MLREAVQDGGSAGRSTTDDHPASYAGERVWGETVASLVVACRRWGWDHERLRNVDLVVDRETGLAIVVTAGDSATGNALYTPQVRYERREVVTRLVNGELDTLFATAEVRPGWVVWFLLHHFTRREFNVPAELSRPEHIGRGGWVAQWAERIIIPPIDGNDRPARRVPVQPDAPATPLVEVRRRAG